MRVFRRVMLAGEEVPETRKILYTATDKVTPNSNSLGTDILYNNWNRVTGVGVIVCENDIVSLGEAAFDGRTSLTSITIPDSVTEIGRKAFFSCSSLTSVTIPNSVTTIGEYAFRGCSSLTSIVIPNSVTTIGEYAFVLCSSLTSVTIPNGVTTIEKYTFNNCSSLTTITIPDSVTSIGEYAFQACTSMQYYDFSTHESVPTLADTYVFYSIPSTCKIIVPDVLYDEWIAATNWSTYASYIIKKSDWDASQTTE